MPGSGSASAASAASGSGGRTRGSSFTWRGSKVEVIDVWDINVEAEMSRMRKLLDRFPYVAMDSEFPGIVVHPLKDASVGSSGATGRAALERFHYDTIRLNVDLLHVIQIGFVLFDADGNSPPGNPVWQFNFRFDSARDIASSESIALLTRAGIDFGRLAREGIESERFGSLLTVSGLVLVPGSKWVTFHAGYDFAYLLKVLTALPLPSTAGAFFDKVRTFFPTVLDCKCLAASVPRRPLSGSLVSISRSLGVPSPSTLHQAGSDALLTKGCFLEVRKALQAALSGDAATTQAIEKRFTWRLFGLAGGDGGTIPSAKAAAAGGTAASGSGGAARGGLSRRR